MFKVEEEEYGGGVGARESVNGGVPRAAASTRRLPTSSRMNMGRSMGFVGLGT